MRTSSQVEELLRRPLELLLLDRKEALLERRLDFLVLVVEALPRHAEPGESGAANLTAPSR